MAPTKRSLRSVGADSLSQSDRDHRGGGGKGGQNGTSRHRHAGGAQQIVEGAQALQRFVLGASMGSLPGPRPAHSLARLVGSFQRAGGSPLERLHHPPVSYFVHGAPLLHTLPVDPQPFLFRENGPIPAPQVDVCGNRNGLVQLCFGKLRSRVGAASPLDGRLSHPAQ